MMRENLVFLIIKAISYDDVLSKYEAPNLIAFKEKLKLRMSARSMISTII
jgi:hypothetical protein